MSIICKAFFSFMFSVIVTSLIGQNTFQKTIGGNGYDDCSDMILTSDGNFALTGSTLSYGAGNGDVYLCKINNNGNIIWAKTYGGLGTEYGLSLQQTTDSGYIIAGSTGDTLSFISKIYIVKTDSLGDTIWTRSYGKQNSYSASSIFQNNDGSYIVSGFSYDSNCILLLKLNSFGDTLWSKKYCEQFHCGTSKVLQTSDGGYIVTGYSSDATIQFEALLLKTDSLGNIVFSKTYGRGNYLYEFANSIIKTFDGGYLISGTNRDSEDNIYLIKLNSAFDTLWTRTLYDTSNLYSYINNASVYQCMDSSYIITGMASSGDSIAIDSASIYLVKTDIFGIPIWSRKFGSTRQYYGEKSNRVLETMDGGLIISGLTSDAGAFIIGIPDIYIIKTNKDGFSNCLNLPTSFVSKPYNTIVGTYSFTVSSGFNKFNTGTIVTTPSFIDTVLCSTTSVQEIFPIFKSISCYPNPFFDYTIIDLQKSDNSIITIDIIDITGRIVKNLDDISTNEVILHKGDMKSGFYFFKAYCVDKVFGIGKFVIE